MPDAIPIAELEPLGEPPPDTLLLSEEEIAKIAKAADIAYRGDGPTGRLYKNLKYSQWIPATNFFGLTPRLNLNQVQQEFRDYVEPAVEKARRGEKLSDFELAALGTAVGFERKRGEQGFMSDIADIVQSSIGMGLQFYMAGGPAGLAVKGATIPAAVGRGAITMAGAVPMVAPEIASKREAPQMVGKDVVSREVGLGEAAGRGALAVGTEMVGGLLTKTGKLVLKHAPKLAGKPLAKVGEMIERTRLPRFGMHGVPEEIAEEALESGLSTAVYGDPLPTPADFAKTAAAAGLLGAGVAAVRRATEPPTTDKPETAPQEATQRLEADLERYRTQQITQRLADLPHPPSRTEYEEITRVPRDQQPPAMMRTAIWLAARRLSKPPPLPTAATPPPLPGTAPPPRLRPARKAAAAPPQPPIDMSTPPAAAEPPTLEKPQTARQEAADTFEADLDRLLFKEVMKRLREMPYVPSPKEYEEMVTELGGVIDEPIDQFILDAMWHAVHSEGPIQSKPEKLPLGYLAGLMGGIEEVKKLPPSYLRSILAPPLPRRDVEPGSKAAVEREIFDMLTAPAVPEPPGRQEPTPPTPPPPEPPIPTPTLEAPTPPPPEAPAPAAAAMEEPKPIPDRLEKLIAGKTTPKVTLMVEAKESGRTRQQVASEWLGMLNMVTEWPSAKRKDSLRKALAYHAGQAEEKTPEHAIAKIAELAQAGDVDALLAMRQEKPQLRQAIYDALYQVERGQLAERLFGESTLKPARRRESRLGPMDEAAAAAAVRAWQDETRKEKGMSELVKKLFESEEGGMPIEFVAALGQLAPEKVAAWGKAIANRFRVAPPPRPFTVRAFGSGLFPDLDSPDKVRQFMTTPTGAGRIPLVGAAIDPRQALANATIGEQIAATFQHDLASGLAVGSLEISLMESEHGGALKWDDAGRITNIKPTEPGDSTMHGDVLEEFQRNPDSTRYQMSDKTRKAIDDLNRAYQQAKDFLRRHKLPSEQILQGIPLDKPYAARSSIGSTKSPKHWLTGDPVEADPWFQPASPLKPRVHVGPKGMQKGFEYGTRYVASPYETLQNFHTRIYRYYAAQRVRNELVAHGAARRLKPGQQAVFGKEAEVSHPLFAGMAVETLTANQLAKAMGIEDRLWGWSKYLRPLSQMMKDAGTIADFAAPFVYFHTLATRAPKSWWLGGKKSLQAFFDPRLRGRVLLENAEIARELSRLGWHFGQTFERAGESPVRKLPGARRFLEAFSTFRDVAAIAIWKQARTALPPSEWGKGVEDLQQMLGSSPMEEVGISPLRAVAERVVFWAPAYWRNGIHLLANVMVGAKRAALGQPQDAATLGAMRTLANIGGVYLVGLMLNQLMLGWDEDEFVERLTPGSRRFMSFELGDDRRMLINLGGPVRGMFHLLGIIAKDPIKNITEGGILDNPAMRWTRGKLGPIPGLAAELSAGKDYLGEDVSWWESVIRRFLPFSINTLTQTGEVTDTVGGFFGLNVRREHELGAYFRKLDQAAKEQFGVRSYDDLPIAKQRRVAKQVGPRPRVEYTERIRKREAEALERLVARLPAGAREFANQHNLHWPQFSYTVGKLSMTAKQRDRYHDHIVPEYAKAIEKLSRSQYFGKLDQEEKQKKFNQRLLEARKKARTKALAGS